MEREAVTYLGSPPPPDAEMMHDDGSPEALGFQDPLSTAIPSSDSLVLTDDLREKIIKLAEFYFSDEKLSKDIFLMSYMKKDNEGFVPVSVIASYKKMRKLVQDNSLIVSALKESTQLVLSSDGEKVKRIHPVQVIKVRDAKLCTVLVENFPENYSTDSIRRVFGDVGNIKNITIHDPHARKEYIKMSKAEKVISGKIHALVEYETVEAAEKAVVSLNDDENWRTGMRVKLLKRMGKNGATKKSGKSTASEKNSNIPAVDDQHLTSIDHHDKPPVQEVEGHPPSERTGQICRGRGRSRGLHGSKERPIPRRFGPGLPDPRLDRIYRPRVRSQDIDPCNINGQGTGNGTLHSGPGIIKCLKPPPRPRMPDGTRGFTLGRGRPPVSNQN